MKIIENYLDFLNFLNCIDLNHAIFIYLFNNFHESLA